MSRPYGVATLFPSSETLVAALRRLRTEGYEQLDVFTPRPVEEALELLPHRRSAVPGVMLVAGALGCGGAFFLQVWAANDYALNVAGRPILSWPAFVPVTFELTVLSACFCGLLALLFLTRLPRLDHPLFSYVAFDRVSQDGYVICVRADDRRYDALAIETLLRALGGQFIEEVRA